MNQLENLFSNTLYHVEEVRKFTVDKNWSRYANFYPYNRIYYIVDGEAEITLKNQVLKLEPGYMYFIPAFWLVNASCENEMTHYFLHFQTSTTINNFFDYYNTCTKIKATEEDLKLFENLQNVYEDHSPCAKLLTDAYFKLLFAKFFEKATFNNVEIMKLAPVLDYIEEHIYEHIEVSYLAKLMNYTPIYFIHIFKSILKVSPLQYILSKKLNIAQLLLTQNNYSIKEIAFKLGFENETYFSRIFMKKCGISPSEFKKKTLSLNKFTRQKKSKNK